jgi:hypothetical protein
VNPAFRVAVAPPGIVTVTFLALAIALELTANVALIVVSFTTVKLLAVTPVPPMVTAVAPVR